MNTAVTEKPAPPFLAARWRDEVVEKLSASFGYRNVMAVPRLVKVSLNMGLGRGVADKKVFEQALTDLAAVSGQKAVLTKARVSISNFKLRKGYTVGARVTLRGRRMHEFLYRLISVVLPRVPDFRGLPTQGFDGAGNYSMGMRELIAFPEIDPDKSTEPLGMDITIVTSARTNEEGEALLTALGMPFQRGDAS